jgi:hypothetical protein
MKVDEQRTRDFAYQIWESEGQPVGQQQRHWEMALKLVEAADSAAELQPGKPARKVRKEEVSIREAPAPRKKSPKEKPAQPSSSKKTAALQSIGKSTK